MSARYAVLVEVRNLTEAERNLLHGVVALLTDPGLDGLRRRFVRGEVAIALDEGETYFPEVHSRPQEVAATEAA